MQVYLITVQEATSQRKIFMRLGNVTSTLPLGDIEAMVYSEDPDLTPPTFLKYVIQLMKENPDTEVSDEAAAQLTTWVAHQAAAQTLATKVTEVLEAKFPTRQSPAGGLQDWEFEWWAGVLRFPWAGRLSDAAIAAGEWVNGKS